MDAERHITIPCGGDAPAHLEAMLAPEWLLTNGTGSFAQGTAAGINTRRYHGLLVAARHPPVDRVVLLSQLLLFVHLKTGNTRKTFELGGCLFASPDAPYAVAPHGHHYLDFFRRGADAEWQWSAREGGIDWRVTQRLVLHDREPAATVNVHVACSNPDRLDSVRVEMLPLMAMRDFHHLNGQVDDSFRVDHDPSDPENPVRLRRGELTATLGGANAKFHADPGWWRNHRYPVETRRGQDDTEHTFAPGRFVAEDHDAEWIDMSLTVALGEEPSVPRLASEERELKLARVAKALSRGETDLESNVARIDLLLAQAAGDFVVRRPLKRPGKKKAKKAATIIAGYPWFADWGRDACIALPGLLLCTGRLKEARGVLRTFAGALRDGLIPNRFDDRNPDQAIYNTIDASLWFVHACLAYYQTAKASKSKKVKPEKDFRKWLGPACAQVLRAYRKGTHADPHQPDAPPTPIGQADGLIVAGSPHSQLTWMDAACGADVFTPRHGACVEINALWCHVQAAWLQAAGPDEKWSSNLAECTEAFRDTFFDSTLGYCIDHRTADGHRDTSCRPNQAIACSLQHSPLPREHQQYVMTTLRDRLLTPVGLRTLPTDDPEYHGTYAGPGYDRDAAYHRGTIWPWLIGPYGEGYLRAFGFSTEAHLHVTEAITPLIDRLTHGTDSIGQLHEIYQADPDADGRWLPRGCPAQAWSIAEVLRVRQLLRRPPAV